ncbi:Hexaprenyldihydroxybenzoate methyltransferase, mitochondrial [Pseudocyphellaria aurata]|nr:Hexaprenyldihydroxybenzoate methyltransferase, mitochondrial [Pseudocyphellaria aurata]
MSTRLFILRNLAARVLFARTVPRRSYSSTSSSVNPDEVAHFNALASTWWDPHGSSRLLHLMNPLRHDFITSCLASPTLMSHSEERASPPSSLENGLRYLDVGCGGGIFAESAARLPSTNSVTAIDPSGEVIAVAKSHALQDPLLQEQRKLEYLQTSVEEFAASSQIAATPSGKQQELITQQYDIVTLFEVIEHISLPAPFLASCLPLVKPGGWLVLSTIARTWTSWLTTKVVAEEFLGIVPRGTHSWGKYIDEAELRNFFRGREGWGGAGGMKSIGCIYVPELGWKMVAGGERWGNYFYGVRRDG